MIEENTRGFVARLQAKSEFEGLTYFERKYLEGVEKRAKREARK